MNIPENGKYSHLYNVSSKHKTDIRIVNILLIKYVKSFHDKKRGTFF